MEKIRYTTDYPDTQLVKMLVRHAVTVNNVRAAEADPSKDRIGGRQPRVNVAPSGPEQARRFARITPDRLREILDGEFAVVSLSRSLARRTKVTAETVRDEWGLSLPIRRTLDLAELHKGYRVFGGHQGRLRAGVVNDEYNERRMREDWDFRFGDSAWNRLGLHYLSRAQTEREVGAHVLRWINRKPPVPEDIVATGLPLVDVGFGHGMSGTRGIAMALHGDSRNPNEINISVAEAEQIYKLPNASAFILSRNEAGLWMERGRIILPED
jgi:broad specificity phosphatase PhoE